MRTKNLIRYIKAKNFSLIKDIEIEFSDGLNVIYGESGSGKSLLLSSLYILIGGKSSPDLIREGEDKAVLECEIDRIGVIQKIIGKSRSIQSIDGENVTLNYLKEKLNNLIENFTQGEQEEIYTRDYQIEFINLFIEDTTLPEKVQKKYKEFVDKSNELETFIKKVEEEKSKKEFYDYQLNEIESLDIKSKDEEEDLSHLITLHSSKENILDETNALTFELNSIETIISKINTRISKLESKYSLRLPILDIDEINLTSHIKKLEDELYSQTQQYYHLEDEYSLDDLNSRLYKIQKLKKKVGKANLEEIIQYKDTLIEYISTIDNSEEEILSKKANVTIIGKDLELLCNELGDQQKTAVFELIPMLSLTLNSLGFEYAKVEDKWTILSSPTPKGNKIPELYVSFNRGFETKPIRKIVSGGEASRLALAFKMLSKDNHILILDEIDTGLSGESLNSVANVLKSINSQIICITHSKEIIACGDKKIKIYKEDVNGKTETKVKENN